MTGGGVWSVTGRDTPPSSRATTAATEYGSSAWRSSAESAGAKTFSKALASLPERANASLVRAFASTISFSSRGSWVTFW